MLHASHIISLVKIAQTASGWDVVNMTLTNASRPITWVSREISMAQADCHVVDFLKAVNPFRYSHLASLLSFFSDVEHDKM
jgi:hypothetical protein